MEDDEMQGEMVPLDDDQGNVRDTEDGGAIVTLDEDTSAADDAEFYANLADTLPTDVLSRLSSQILQLIERDKESRKERDKQYEEGLRRTGLGNDAPGGADFQGASKVVHPMLTEACVDFAARAMKEIFPTGGPVKDHIPGRITEAKLKRAKRKSALLNWQLTVQCEDVRAELEQLMTQLPLGGAQYLKVTWDERRNRPVFLFVAVDDMLLPYSATNFYTAGRRTHVEYLTQSEYESRVKSGMYRDVDLSPAGMEPEQTLSGRANDKIEGREATSYNEDGMRTVYETSISLDIAEDNLTDGPAPYLISIDKPTGQVLAIYRNWDEEDESQTELHHFVEWSFIPWRGAYPIGLPHMIGGLAAASTGALRALLDSAHINNAATMLKLKGGQVGGQSISVQPTQVVELEAGLNVDDIRKLAMPMPFNPPSVVLFQLLGFLVDAGKGVVRTSLDDIADHDQNAPVGTTLAKIEQGMVVFSAIHGRLCDSMTRVLRIVGQLNGKFLDDEKLVQEVGEELATRADFQGPLDVVPVSDPNIFSEAQRYGQIQAIAQRAALFPQIYNIRKVEQRILQILKVPDADSLLVPETAPKEQNPVAENVAASMGQPIIAFPAQDHLAHLQAHIDFLNSPLFGQLPIIAQSFIPAILNHLKEHIVLWYASAAVDLASEGTGKDIGDMVKEMVEDDQTDHTDELKALDRLLAAAGQKVLAQGQQMLAGLPPIIQQAQQLAQQFMPNPAAQDPRLAIEGQKVQVQQQSLQLKAQTDQQKLAAQQQKDAQQLALEQQQMQQDAQLQSEHNQIEATRVQVDAQGRAAELSAKMTMNEQDNQTAAAISAAEIAAGHRAKLSTGTGINPGNEG